MTPSPDIKSRQILRDLAAATTCKPIITFKAERTSPHQTSRRKSPRILFFVHLKMCIWHLRITLKLLLMKMRCVLMCHFLRLPSKNTTKGTTVYQHVFKQHFGYRGYQPRRWFWSSFRGSVCVSFIMSVSSKHDWFRMSSLASHLFLMIL